MYGCLNMRPLQYLLWCTLDTISLQIFKYSLKINFWVYWHVLWFELYANLSHSYHTYQVQQAPSLHFTPLPFNFFFIVTDMTCTSMP